MILSTNLLLVSGEPSTEILRYVEQHCRAVASKFLVVRPVSTYGFEYGNDRFTIAEIIFDDT